MKIGYARVSTLEQNLDLQIDELKRAGCEKIITDKLSGTIAERPGLFELKKYARQGDTIIVWRLDRLGRSLKHLLSLINDFQNDGIEFKSLQESIDTTTSTGKLIFHIFASLAEFERNLIAERVKAGLEAARARGRQGGRPKKLCDDKKDLAISLYKDRKHSIPQICSMIGITKPTLYRYIREKD